MVATLKFSLGGHHQIRLFRQSLISLHKIGESKLCWGDSRLLKDAQQRVQAMPETQSQVCRHALKRAGSEFTFEALPSKVKTESKI